MLQGGDYPSTVCQVKESSDGDNVVRKLEPRMTERQLAQRDWNTNGVAFLNAILINRKGFGRELQECRSGFVSRAIHLAPTTFVRPEGEGSSTCEIGRRHAEAAMAVGKQSLQKSLRAVARGSQLGYVRMWNAERTVVVNWVEELKRLVPISSRGR